MRERGCLEKTRQPLLCGWAFEFVAEFPAKLVLTGYPLLSADVFPRQGSFGGFSPVVR